MPNLYQRKLIRGMWDLIWEVGNFGCLACRCHWKVKCYMGQSKGHVNWTLILMVKFLWIEQRWWHKTSNTFNLVKILSTEAIDLFYTFLHIRLVWVKLSVLSSCMGYVAGFPTGVEKIGGWVGGVGSSKFDGGGELKSIHGGSMGGLKCCWKIPVKEFIW